MDRFKEKIERCKPTGTIKRLERKLEDIYLSFKGNLHNQNIIHRKNDEGFWQCWIFFIDYGKRARDAGYGHFDGQNDLNRRPSTPEVTIDVDLEVEARKPHVVLLQKIARGRTIQKLVISVFVSSLITLSRLSTRDYNSLKPDKGRNG